MASSIVKKTGKIILIMFLIIILVLSIFISKKVKTLYSLKRIDNTQLYVMNYYSDYNFDKYLKSGSISNKDFIKSIRKNILFSRTSSIDNNIKDGCTTFSASDSSGNHLYGRNLDLPTSSPTLILYTTPKKGYSSISMVNLGDFGYKDSAKLANTNPISMIRNNLYLLGAPYIPHDGMNEKGLVVATLDVPEVAGEKDSGKITIQRWSVSRLLLDNAKNVDEAIELIKKYNCFDGKVHFFIADAEGNSASVEYLNYEMKVVKNSEKYQVLTNYYVSSPSRLGDGQVRYDKATELLKDKNGVVTSDEAMDILKNVSNHTVWSTIYNQNTGEVNIALRQQYDDVKTFSLKLKK
jgi:hypothetical protein